MIVSHFWCIKHVILKRFIKSRIHADEKKSLNSNAISYISDCVFIFYNNTTIRWSDVYRGLIRYTKVIICIYCYKRNLCSGKHKRFKDAQFQVCNKTGTLDGFKRFDRTITLRWKHFTKKKKKKRTLTVWYFRDHIYRFNSTLGMSITESSNAVIKFEKALYYQV